MPVFASELFACLLESYVLSVLDPYMISGRINLVAMYGCL